jgi:hypothetical protein
MHHRGRDEGLHGLEIFLTRDVGAYRIGNKHQPDRRRGCGTNKSIEIMPITHQYGGLCINVTPRFLVPHWTLMRCA